MSTPPATPSPAGTPLRFACACALLAIGLTAAAQAREPVAVPKDLLDDPHYREEWAINEFTAPSIARLFEQLEALQPLHYKDLKRKLPPNQPADRGDLAIEIGFLIADGFLAVNSGNLKDIESLATNLARYGDGLGAGERVKKHSNALLESAEEKDVETLKKELAATQKIVEAELVELRDADLAHLISLGGWIRALDVASSVVTTTYTPERAKHLMREDIADYYEYSIASLEPKISERPCFVKMREILTGLRKEMTAEPEAEVGKDRVASIRRSSASLVKLALERQQ